METTHPEQSTGSWRGSRRSVWGNLSPGGERTITRRRSAAARRALDDDSRSTPGRAWVRITRSYKSPAGLPYQKPRATVRDVVIGGDVTIIAGPLVESESNRDTARAIKAPAPIMRGGLQPGLPYEFRGGTPGSKSRHGEREDGLQIITRS